tara:strand:+ start:22 stop:450 length:429 start_codon:yes stop_codon:yes gene_type:complete
MKPIINLEIAKILADACESHQKKTGYRPVNIAIIDAGGDLVIFRRQNNAFLLSIDITIAKVNSSAGIPVPTRTIQDIVYGKDGSPGRVPGLPHSKNIVAFPGGMPIKTKNGDLLGAIGVSGTTGDEDEQCANAALLSIEKYL